MNESEILIIATSAPSNRPAYRRDLLNCFCYPNGTNVYFSYRKRWIDNELLTETKKLNENDKVLIVFCDNQDGQDGQADFNFIPLRYATFIGFEPKTQIAIAEENSHIAVKFKLGDFVKYEGPLGSENKMDAWTKWMKLQPSCPRLEGHPSAEKSKFVFVANNFKDGDSKDNNLSWLELAKVMATGKTLKNCSFYRISNINEISYPQKDINLTKIKSLDRNFFAFKPSKTYMINLQYYLDHQKASTPKILIPRTSTQSINISFPLVENIGLSTRATVFATCKRVYETEFASLVIEDPEDKDIHVARAELSILIEPVKWLLPTMVSLIAIGAFSTGISKELVENTFSGIPFITSNVFTIIILVKILGSCLVGLGSYLGFRKIP